MNKLTCQCVNISAIIADEFYCKCGHIFIIMFLEINLTARVKTFLHSIDDKGRCVPDFTKQTDGYRVNYCRAKLFRNDIGCGYIVYIKYAT